MGSPAPRSSPSWSRTGPRSIDIRWRVRIRRNSRCFSMTSASTAWSSNVRRPSSRANHSRNRTSHAACGKRAAMTRSGRHAGRRPRLQRGLDLRLEPDLLVEADLEVGEKDELCPLDRVGLEAGPVVVRERLAQVALAGRRVARSEALHESGEGSRVVGRIGPQFDIETGELAADLGEDPEVPPGDGRARTIQRRGRIDDRPHGVERGVGRDARAVARGLDLDVARRLDRGRRRSECFLQAAPEVLLADRASGLLRGPRRVGTPIGERAEARRRGRRQLVICLRDPEVADHRIGDGGDPIDVVRSQVAPGGRGARHGLPV